MAYVRNRRIDRVLPAIGAHLFSDCRDSTKLESRSTSSRFRRETISLQLRGGFIEVVLDLISDLAIGCRPIQEGTKSTYDLAPQRHASTLRPSEFARPLPRAGSSLPFRSRAAACHRV